MIRGWCPTVHRPMPTGDGLLVRVKPFGGRLPAAAVLALAGAAEAYGNGAVELTGRGNIQVRGLHDPAAFARAVVSAGLADADPVREARRNVVAVPPCDDALVAELEALLAETAGLPAKFCVVVQGEELRVRAALAGRADEFAPSWPDLIRPSTASERPQRPAWNSERHENASDLATRIAWMPGSSPGMTRLGRLGAECESALPAGQSQAEGSRQHLIHLPFGQTTASELARLAAQTPELRTTPWRAFLSPIPVPGFATEASTITACAGAPACASATTSTRADATRLQAMGFTNLHVSGCAKGCANPRPTTTLVGRNGRYDLVRHGHASDPPTLTGLTLEQAAAAL